jgi:tetratricopeptide (TPR) repeat protein
MRETLHFPAEVTELLSEIAARPDSILRRRIAHRSGAPRADRPIPVSTPGLSADERELLAVHREEAAYALRLAAWNRLASLERDGERVVFGQTVARRAPPPDPRAEHDGASRVLRSRPEAQPEDPQYAYLQALITPDGAPRASIVDLCLAARAFVPSWKASHMIGLAYLVDDRAEAGLIATRRAILEAPDPNSLAIGLSLAAEFFARREQWPLALRTAQRASDADPELISARLAQIWASVHLEDRTAAEHGLRELSRLLGSRLEPLDEHAERFRRLAPRLRTRLSRGGLQIARELHGNDPLAGRWFDGVVA